MRASASILVWTSDESVDAGGEEGGKVDVRGWVRRKGRKEGKVGRKER